MNILEKIFKRRVNYQRENYKAVQAKIGQSQEAVFQAVKKMAYPCNGRQVARYMGLDSASVTPRLAELTRKGRLTVVDVKKGLDKKWRKYYIVSRDKKF